MVLTIPGRRLLTFLMALWLVLQPVAARGESGQPGADVVLLLDRSGSMAGNDPTDLSATGARVFLDMLDPADRVAVVAFDTNARTLLPLTPVGDGKAARRAVDGLGKPTGQWTDVKGALQAALGLLGQAAADRAPAVLLFTDGKPETQPDGVPPGYREELARTVSLLAGRSIPVFTVGLGQADYATLSQIARGTKAESFAATSDSQVVRLFADVLSRIKERQVVISFTEDLQAGAAGQVHTFQVPPYTRLLTLTGVGGTGSVRLSGTAPGGGALEGLPGLKVSQGGNYTVYTVTDPPPGAYTVRLEGSGRVEAHGQTESALRISLVEPQPYSQVPGSGKVALKAMVAGDPDPTAGLELYAQAGAGTPVKLAQTGPGSYAGSLEAGDGRLALWAVRAGGEVARREFTLYPMATSPGPAARAGAATGASRRPWWLAVVGAAVGAVALLGLGGANWRRLKAREETLSGRLGAHSLAGRGKRLPIGDLAVLEAELIPGGWAPLAGLYLTRRRLRIHIRATSGIRLQINGRPPADGRLYHGDEVTLGGETMAFHNPRLGRRPAVRQGRRYHSHSIRG